MSSYLSKSKKDFKPKAPARRPNVGVGAGGVSSSQSSIRGSAERQTQTPQPQLTFINSSPAVRPHGISASPVPQVAEEAAADVDVPPTPLRSQLHRAFTNQAIQEQRSPRRPKGVSLAECQIQDSPIQDSFVPAATNISLQTIEPSSSSTFNHTQQSTTQADDRDQLNTLQFTSTGVIDVETLSRPNGDLSKKPSQPSSKRQKTLISTPAQATTSFPNRLNKDLGSASLSSAPARNVDHATSYTPLITALASLTENTNTSNRAATPTAASPPQEHPTASSAHRSKEPPGNITRKRKQKAIKKRHLQGINKESVEAAEEEDGLDATAIEPDGRKKRRKGRRAGTPENAESIQISEDILTMSELTKDLRQGKKSSREIRLRERDFADLARKQNRAQIETRQRGEQSIGDGETEPSGVTSIQLAGAVATGGVSTTENPTEGLRTFLTTMIRSPPSTRIAPQVRLVNGQIVQDEESRMIDRHGVAAALRASEDDVRLEDELTRHVNAGSYMKREIHSKWTVQATEIFYDGLRMFGTDFMTISKMLPGRSRRQVKLKFNKEERNDKEKVQRALLLERRPADLQNFERLAGEAFPDPALLEENMKNDRLRLEEEQQKEVEAMEELVRQRERDAAAESDMLRLGTDANVIARPGTDSNLGRNGPSAKGIESASSSSDEDKDEEVRSEFESPRGRRLARRANTEKSKVGRNKSSQVQRSTPKPRSGAGIRATKRKATKVRKVNI